MPDKFVTLLPVTAMAMVMVSEETEAQGPLKAAQSGDRAAQAQLFHMYRDRVARHVLRMVGSTAAVDDLVQDVFIRAFMALPGYRGGDAQLGAWFYRIATNLVRNWWDSQRRRERREEIAAQTPPDEPADPEAQFADRDRVARFYAAIGALPHTLREAFIARVVEGMTLAEASAALGRPVSTISYQTRRAEQTLCQALGLPYTESPVR